MYLLPNEKEVFSILFVIVPGYVGVRNIKWVNKITLSNEEADGIWQQGISYKGLPHYITDVKQVDLNKIAPIQEMPVQSFIVNIEQANKHLKIKGFILKNKYKMPFRKSFEYIYINEKNV